MDKDYFLKKEKSVLRVIPLGGLGEVTKNMYIYETNREIIIIDCGLGFPNEEMYGVDSIIPDISYLLDKKEKIKAIIITHGHDDHIGALPYLIKDLNAPIFTLPLTAGLIDFKFKEKGLDSERFLRVISPSDILFFKDFKIEFFRVSHSIPDAVGVILNTPVGIVIHTGDFKFDWTPVDKRNVTDIAKLAITGEKGVLALFSDCVRVENSGYTLSEAKIEKTFDQELDNFSGRVFITTFSSNISRIQQAFNSAEKHNRFVCILGRSMEQSINVAKKIGYIKIPTGIIVSLKNAKKIPDKNLLFLISGSQGQPESALVRVGNKDHEIKIKDNDLVIFASDPVPGNENAVFKLIDCLTKQGAEVKYSEITENIHVSGHASSEELLMLLSIVKPKFLIPISATFRQLKRFGLLAEKKGISKENIFIGENGSIFEFTRNSGRIVGKIALKNILIDGLGIGDVGSIVIKDRKQMAADGIVIIILQIEEATGKILGKIDVISRGFVYVKESENLFERAKREVRKELKKHQGVFFDWYLLKRALEDRLRRFFLQETKRRPIILATLIRV